MVCVRVDSSNLRSFQIQKGVRQGCVMSPNFFNVYNESILKSIDKSNGISINGEYVTNICYADDAVLIANSPNNLQKMLDEVVMNSREKSLHFDVKKTECMTLKFKKIHINFHFTSLMTPLDLLVLNDLL